MKHRFPLVTLCAVAGALVIWFVPQFSPSLVFERREIAQGEYWRLVTGHWVHFSVQHLVYNLLALGIAGWLIEWHGFPHFGLLCALSALVIGLSLFVFEPRIQCYGGLSGIATAAIIYLALHSATQGAWQRIVLGVVLLLLGIKLGWEWFADQPLLVRNEDPSVVVSPLAHLSGALTALMVFVVRRSIDWFKSSQTLTFVEDTDAGTETMTDWGKSIRSP
jgi:rhomboid family GlyGly-CTERM serine protease